MQQSFQKLLSEQFLITAFVEQKLQIVNYIKSGYDENEPILINNSFLHFTAHIYYRSVIVDLYALFGPGSQNNKCSIFNISKESGNKIKTDVLKKVRSWLKEKRNNIEIIKKLRHQQIAHFDFEQIESISLNFDNLEVLNDLFNLAKRIISLYGESTNEKSESMGFDFENKSQYVRSLKALISKAAKI